MVGRVQRRGGKVQTKLLRQLWVARRNMAARTLGQLELASLGPLSELTAKGLLTRPRPRILLACRVSPFEWSHVCKDSRISGNSLERKPVPIVRLGTRFHLRSRLGWRRN